MRNAKPEAGIPFWLAGTTILVGLSVAVLGSGFWKPDARGSWWQSVCALSFSPDGKTLAVGLYDGKSFCEDFRWRIGDLGQTVALFDAGSGAAGGVLVRARYPGTWGGLPSTPLDQFIAFAPAGDTLAVGGGTGR
jgi:hypothetical protein